jgi:hypothetical protein
LDAVHYFSDDLTDLSRQRIGNSALSKSVHADLTTQDGEQHHGA